MGTATRNVASVASSMATKVAKVVLQLQGGSQQDMHCTGYPLHHGLAMLQAKPLLHDGAVSLVCQLKDLYHLDTAPRMARRPSAG